MKTLIVIGLVFVAAQVAQARRMVKPKEVISLERTRCNGECPQYRIAVFADGTLTYDGREGVAVVGHRERVMSKAELAALDVAFAKAKFFDLVNDGLPRKGHSAELMTCKDSPHAIVAYTHAGKHQLLDDAHCGGETALSRLEDAIDLIVDDSAWVRAAPAAAAGPPSLHRSEIVATMERTICFGKCPAYKLTIHEDGLVEYLGKSDVATVGDKVRMVGPAQVAALRAAFDAVRFVELDDTGHLPRQDSGRTATMCADTPHANLTYVKDGKVHQVNDEHCGGEAPGLEALERRFDEAAQSAEWINAATQ